MCSRNGAERAGGRQQGATLSTKLPRHSCSLLSQEEQGPHTGSVGSWEGQEPLESQVAHTTSSLPEAKGHPAFLFGALHPLQSEIKPFTELPIHPKHLILVRFIL